MKTMSAKKWSMLGLVLMGASAVTAAILPKNNSTGNKTEADGSLTDSGWFGDTLTCKITNEIDNPCFASTAAGSGTTGGVPNSNASPTVNNTTLGDQA